MWRVSYAVKAAIAHTLYWLGILELWRRVALRNRAVVLMYHRVLSSAERERTGSHPGYVVGDQTFNRQIEYIRKRFTVLSEQQFAKHLDNQRPFPNSSCLITFDDGWIDNLTNALPVLRRHGLPAIIYLPVNFIGRRRLFAREALTHLLANAVMLARNDDARLARVRGVLDRNRLQHILDITAANPLPLVIEAVAQSHWRAQDSAQLIDDLQDAMGVAVDHFDTPDTFVSWDQVREMAGSEITFGGHGVEHRLLGELPPSEAEREIRDAMSAISSQVGPVISFSYPNGSLTPAVRDMVQAAGYQFAVTTESGLVESGDDRFTIRRVNIHEDMTRSTPMFLARILGLF